MSVFGNGFVFHGCQRSVISHRLPGKSGTTLITKDFLSLRWPRVGFVPEICVVASRFGFVLPPEAAASGRFVSSGRSVGRFGFVPAIGTRGREAGKADWAAKGRMACRIFSLAAWAKRIGVLSASSLTLEGGAFALAGW